MPEQSDSIFGQYSILDVATSLFVSSLWLPNVASPVKHTYLTAIFASVSPKLFSKENRIKSYEDFKRFCGTLYGAVPDFSSMEDFVPETEWGDIKFYHRERSYRIFYGCEAENIYDFLELFVVLHAGHDKEYAYIAGRSPMDELENCLKLQDHIITSLKTQPDPDSVDTSPGYTEIPSEEFWKEASCFYSNFKPEGNMKKFAEKMSIDWGNLPEELLQKGKFEKAVFTGKLLPCMFLRAGGRFYPILPRRFSHILFNQWGSIIRKFYDSLDKKNSYAARINEELYGFVLKRFNKKDCFFFVQALTTEGKPHEVLFPLAFPSRDKIILVHITPPMITPQVVVDHLKEVTPKINEAISLISDKPNRLVLTLENEVVEHKKRIKPELLVVIPTVSMEPVTISSPSAFAGRLAPLDQFLAMVDEINDGDDMAGFFNFLDEIEKLSGNPIISLMDKYAEYKHSLGIPIEGALEPDFIILDPHAGSDYRFRSLKKFWEEYPAFDFSAHPRSWKVTHETDSRIVLESRSSHGKIICSRVENTDISIAAPFLELNHNEVLIAYALMQCAEYYLQLYEDLKKHRFFRTHTRLHIIFFPCSLVGRKEFRHLRNLDPAENLWKADIIELKPGLFGIRLVFNTERLTKELEGVTTNRIELDLLKEILFQLNKAVPDPDLPEIKAALNKFTGQAPKCIRIFQQQKPAAFPQFVRPCKPDLSHTRAARKRIAQIAKETGFAEGDYAHEEAKAELKTLKAALVAEINSEVRTLDYSRALPLSIERIDALINEIEFQRVMLKEAGALEVDYDRAETLSTHENDHVRLYRSYQYLIEKLVQLQPEGKEKLGNEKCKYLLEFIRGLMAFQDSSDYLHYGVAKMRMSVRHDLVIELHQEGEMEEKARKLAEERAQIRLGQKGNSQDGILVPENLLGKFLDDFNSAFLKDLGFSLENMINFLELLSNWPKYQDNVEEATYYSATIDEITETFLLKCRNLTRDEVRLIINFLTLRSEDILRVLDQTEECEDIPIWESNKRPARYTLRPLVLIVDRYHWGAHSALRSGIIWSGGAGGNFPVDLQGAATQNVLEEIKLLLGKALEGKTHEIVSRYTRHARRSVKLHKINTEAGHPPELGDYDNLAFFPEKGVILNIECKNIPQVRCIKDSKRLRERIFGVPGKRKGYLSQVGIRQKYLRENLKSIADDLGWPVDSENLPGITGVFLTQNSDWWTKHPVDDVDVEFLQIELLGDFIEKL